MSFKEIIGQEAAIDFLRSNVAARRVAHAYIFVGPDGVGKKKAALDFAKLLLCSQPVEGEACGSCASCLKVDGSNHPDVQSLSPEGQFIKIDAIREACHRLSLKGFESSYKVLIIDEARALNEESSNALLKTLEEPSSGTVIILIANTLKFILPTIVSRCQRVVFSSIRKDVLGSMLEKQWGVPAEAAAYLAGLSEGSLGAALKFHKGRLFDRKNDLIKNVLDKDLALEGLLDMSSAHRQEKLEDITEVLLVLSSWFRDLFMAKVSGELCGFINSDRTEDIMRNAPSFSFAELEDRMVAIADVTRDLKRNANARIALTKLRAELWKQ